VIKTNIGDARKVLLESFQKYNVAHNKWILDNQKWFAEHAPQTTTLTLQQQVNAADKPAQAPPGTVFKPNKEPVLADFVDKSIIETIVNEVSVQLFKDMHKEFLDNIDLDKIKADIETTLKDHEKALELVVEKLKTATEFNKAGYNSQKENLDKLIVEERKKVQALAETNATQAFLTRSIFEKLSSDPEMINGVKDLWRSILSGKEELKMKEEMQKNPNFGRGVNLLKRAVELNPAGKKVLSSAAGLAASTLVSKASPTATVDGAASTFIQSAGVAEKTVRFGGTNAAAASAAPAPQAQPPAPPQAQPPAQAQTQAPPQAPAAGEQLNSNSESEPQSKPGNAVAGLEETGRARRRGRGGARYIGRTRKNKSKN